MAPPSSISNGHKQRRVGSGSAEVRSTRPNLRPSIENGKSALLDGNEDCSASLITSNGGKTLSNIPSSGSDTQSDRTVSENVGNMDEALTLFSPANAHNVLQQRAIIQPSSPEGTHCGLSSEDILPAEQPSVSNRFTSITEKIVEQYS